MAENTLQFEWIVLIKLGLESCFMDRHDVFVAGDLFWYPVEGRPDIRLAPDVMAAVGRPKGHRGSYMQWLEDDIAPQVIFEILSPGNRAGEMAKKFAFYQRHGVEEYYIYDPEKNTLEGYLRQGKTLQPIPEIHQWISPLLGIRFEWTLETLKLFKPDGEPFLSYLQLLELNKEAVEKLNRQRELLFEEKKKAQKAHSEMLKERKKAENYRRQADEEKRIAEKEKHRAEEEKQRANQEKQRANEEKRRANEEKRRADKEKQRADGEKRRAEQEREKAQQQQQIAEQEQLRAEQERKKAEEEKQRAEQERHRAELAENQARKLAEKLRELGLDPGSL